MTVLDAISRAAVLALALYTMNRLRERRGVPVTTTSSPKKIAALRVAGFLTGVLFTAFMVYFRRHELAATFHIR
jgi:hypothetical protein